MIQEDILVLVQAVWNSNKTNSAIVAAACFKEYPLPPAATTLIENLPALLADLQKRAFFHGATAMICALEEMSKASAPVTAPPVN